MIWNILCVDDAIALISQIKPSLGILNHFGAEIVFWGLDKAASHVEEKTGIKTIAAREFTEVNFAQSFEINRLKLVNPIGIAYKSR